MKSVKEQVPGYPDLRWCWHYLGEMEPILLYDMLALREAIFVVEQTCLYQELDGLDKIAQHLLVLQGDTTVACLRILPPGELEARVRIGRVAVLPGWRKRGIARAMVKMAVDRACREFPSNGVFLDAQTYLQGFYESLGFRTCGNEFLEDGIPHIPMQMQACLPTDG
jgi:ElaA protein